ncbi:MAG: hypothetical protein AB7E79_15535 [Rhodospirillaceae bacterium]
MGVLRGPWSGDGVLTTLEDCVKAERDLWAFCRHCGHASRVRTKDLVLKLDFVSLAQAARAMRCIRCSQRACILLPDRKWVGRD